MFMILKTPAFKDHPGVEKIKKNNPIQDPTNVAIKIVDYRNTNPPRIDNEEDDPSIEKKHVSLDIKLLVINTGATSFSSEPLESLEKKHPFLRLLTKDEEHSNATPYRIVSNCSASSPIPVFEDSEMSQIIDYTTSLQGVYRHALMSKNKITGYHAAKGKDDEAIYDKGITSESSQPVSVILDNQSQEGNMGLIKNLGDFTCDSGYYWSSRTSSYQRYNSDL